MKLCFIWHMHQPYYKDPLSGTYLLPWVRLHGCKDYLDMVTLADEYPSVKMCFNLVPSLLDQLEDYAASTAIDYQLELSRRRPAELNNVEKIEITRQFFSANPPTMIEPYPRYQELRELCTKLQGHDLVAKLTDQDLLDLQVWYNATWIDPTLRGDPRISGLYEKGRGFSETEKQQLLDYQREIIGRIIPAYRQRQDAGRIEVSFSPYYHPILPLLIDTDVAQMGMPQAKLPERRFTHPEDARWQIAKATERYRELFGRDQRGMWPSEGSVSEAILPLLAEQGIGWIATDEEIYAASVPEIVDKSRGARAETGLGFHQPLVVSVQGQELGILFRDHTLSDKIGFVYSKWDPDRAAHDFVEQLLELDKLLAARSDAEPLVTIILDGENAWEYYRNDGVDFLRALYQKLEQSDKLATVLPSDVFSESEKIERLSKLFPGSWINHDFHVWI
ncbi:MAG: glycoside hydrolase family 57 protein, partial [bacterium]